MKLTYYHYLKSLTLPQTWSEVESIDGGANAQTVRSFAPNEEPSVRLELFYRGLPVSQSASLVFRSVLKSAPHLLFDSVAKYDLDAAQFQTLADLEECLGNVGNNQLVNKSVGRQGAPFLLERLEALVWNQRPLIAARGYFKNPENNLRINEFCGFFIDAKPLETSCRVEEIYLQAPRQDLYIKYLPVFQQTVASIEWR